MLCFSRGLKSEYTDHFLKQDHVRQKENYYCPVDTPFTLPQPGTKSVCTAPKMYNTEYQHIGSEKPITVWKKTKKRTHYTHRLTGQSKWFRRSFVIGWKPGGMSTWTGLWNRSEGGFSVTLLQWKTCDNIVLNHVCLIKMVFNFHSWAFLFCKGVFRWWSGFTHKNAGITLSLGDNVDKMRPVLKKKGGLTLLGIDTSYRQRIGGQSLHTWACPPFDSPTSNWSEFCFIFFKIQARFRYQIQLHFCVLSCCTDISMMKPT